MTELAVIPRESTEIELGTLRANTPAALLAAASDVATPLAKMIRDRNLANNIQGRSYVRCEGWTTMGAMLGVIPQELSNTADENGVYTAVVELVNIRTGAVVGRASAECGRPDELDRSGKPVWSNRAAYARRSMAATRATSKAFRLSFSWIMTLAGYEATPAEEMDPVAAMDAEVVAHTPRPAPRPVRHPSPAALPNLPPGTQRFIGTVTDVSEKDGERNGKPWKKFGVQLVNEHGEKSGWLGTFDTEIGAAAKRLKDGGDLTEAWYTDDGKFLNLVDISAAIFEQ